MITFAQPVRANTPQQITYTFKDQDLAIIDLTSYVTVNMEVKTQNNVFSTTSAVFLSPKTNGQVQKVPYTFDVTHIGKTMVQFYCVDGAGAKIFGEPILLNVVKNVEDAAISEVLQK